MLLKSTRRRLSWRALGSLAALACFSSSLSAQQAAKSSPASTPQQQLVSRYCVGCHNQKLKTGGLALDTFDITRVGDHPEVWEKVADKLRVGLMPPARAPRPDAKTYDDFRLWLNAQLDTAAVANPNPGRTEIFHRLNRTEYQNAIRDLLALDVNSADLLPADDSSNGFDNMAGTLRISDSLMERYLSASKTISRLAVGSPLPAVDSKMYRLPPDMPQDGRADGLPLGTRGGILIHHLFPRDADYEIRLDIAGTKRLYEEHKLEVSVDDVQAKLFVLDPPKKGAKGDPGIGVYGADGQFKVRVHVAGGPHDVGVAFFRIPTDLLEQVRKPFPNPRIMGGTGGPAGAIPEVAGVTILGPYDDKGPGESPSRKLIFTCYPNNPAEEAGCAKQIVTNLAHHAYRRAIREQDLGTLMSFYDEGRKDGGSFDNGIEFALRRMLVSPSFLFRIEADPQGSAVASASGITHAAVASPNRVYRLGDYELASRLSFFLWSSIPDQELLNLADQGKLRDDKVLAAQVTRMLRDPRSSALTTDFASQWLELRNIDLMDPGDPFSLAYDQALRQGLKRETELFVESIIRDDRPAMELLTAKYTFVNERVAQHYGIAGVVGSDFRRVDLAEDSPRRGLLGKGAILTITSRPNRTSPVLRGKYILRELLGSPPPDPPPNVPALPDQKTVLKVATVRERTAQHRANEPCATCHSMIDPPGFALENFDAIGRWRTVDESYNVLDTSGVLPDGTKFTTLVEFRNALAAHPERFIGTLTQKLMAYALGRGLEYYDMPAIRKVMADSAKDDYRMHSLILGIVKSYPFEMRRVDPAGPSVAALR